MPRMSRMPLKSRMRHSLLRISLLLPVDRRPVGQVSGLGLIIELLLLYRAYSSASASLVLLHTDSVTLSLRRPKRDLATNWEPSL